MELDVIVAHSLRTRLHDEQAVSFVKHPSIGGGRAPVRRNGGIG